MPDLSQLVARNVRRYREERGFSLGELARRSGLSKQTLSKLEQGLGNPTIETLGAVAEALDVPSRRFFAERGMPTFVQRDVEASWDLKPGYDQRKMDEVYGSGYVRTLLLRFTKERSQDVEAHQPGTLHHMYVVSGRVQAGPVGDQRELGPGDFMRFAGDVVHRHDCLTDEAMVVMVTTLPQSRQSMRPVE